MMTKALGVCLLLVAVQNLCAAYSIPEGLVGADVLSTPSLHFTNLDTGVALDGHYSTEISDSHEIQVFSFRGVGCNCNKLTCECCAGIDVSWLPTTKGCISIVYLPGSSAVKIALILNNKELISKTISLKNPIPLCVSIPYVPGGKVCALIHDIEVVANKLKACVNMEVRLFGSTVVKMEFDCFHLGSIPVADEYLPMQPQFYPELYSQSNRTALQQEDQ
nr:PREDICTED: uncharacterized protein LOC105662181 [Megachile rotundata]